MLTSGMQEEQQARVTLALPEHTEPLFGEVLRFCYNRTLPINLLATNFVDLWRLADYLECQPLLDALRATLRTRLSARAFSQGVD